MSLPLTGSHVLSDDAMLAVAVGQRQWCFMHNKGDILWTVKELSAERTDCAVEELPLPDLHTMDVSTWRRWTSSQSVRQLFWQPCLPDLPVVVKPRFPLDLASDANVDVFVGLPLHMQFLGGENRQLITDQSSIPLSKTWAGSKTSGEIAVAMKSRGRRELEEVQASDLHRCLCSVRFSNRSDALMAVRRFVIRAPELHLYYHDGYWTDDSEVICHGERLDAEVRHSQAPPRQRPQAELVSEPRKAARHLLRQWAVFG